MKVKTGTTYNSRRQSNFIKMLTPEQRDEHIKQFIAACNADELVPFIHITKHDKHFREIEYEIRIPDSET